MSVIAIHFIVRYKYGLTWWDKWLKNIDEKKGNIIHLINLCVFLFIHRYIVIKNLFWIKKIYFLDYIHLSNTPLSYIKEIKIYKFIDKMFNFSNNSWLFEFQLLAYVVTLYFDV